MYLQKSWLKKRKVFFIYFSLEIIIYFLFNQINFFYSESNNFYILIWIIMSYFFGRYHNYALDKKEYLISKFIQLLITFFYTNIIFTFLIIAKNIFYKQYLFSIYFLIKILIFSLLSFFSLAITQYTFSKKINKLRKWLFIGEENRFNDLKNLLTIHKKKINLKRKINPIIKKDLFEEKYNGIIISNNKLISEEEKAILIDIQSSGFPLMDEITWMEYECQRFPSELIEFHNLINKSINLNINSLSFRIKRFTDIFISLILIILTAPIIIFCGFLIFSEDNGPIFYSQLRRGYGGNEFKIWKLRSMSTNSEPKGAIWSTSNDKRVTKIGKFIRSTGIDEIPQLINIFKGDMSFIGPRPERPEIDEKLILEIPFYNLRYFYKPGLSGWAQVNYPYASSIKDTKNKLSYDFYYMKNFSIWLDILIFIKTIRLILNFRKSN